MFFSYPHIPLHCALSLLLPLALAQSHPARGLIYSATADFRHDSILTARDALIARGRSIDLQFDATEDPSRFTDGSLAPYDLLVFLMNTGEGAEPPASLAVITPPRGREANSNSIRAVLDDAGKAALQRYFDLGGNFVAIHAASDCLRNTTFYGREVGERSSHRALPSPILPVSYD